MEKIINITFWEQQWCWILDESLFSSKNEYEFKIITYLHFLYSIKKNNVTKNDILKKISWNTKTSQENFSKYLDKLSNLDIYKKVVNLEDIEVIITRDKHVIDDDKNSKTWIRNLLFESIENACNMFNVNFSKDIKNSISLNTRLLKWFLDKNNITLEEFNEYIKKYKFFYDGSYFKSLAPVLNWIKEYRNNEEFYNSSMKIIVQYIQIKENRTRFWKNELWIIFYKHQKALWQLLNTVWNFDNIVQIIKESSIDFNKNNISWTLDTVVKHMSKYWEKFIMEENIKKIDDTNKAISKEKSDYSEDFIKILTNNNISLSDKDVVDEYYHIYTNEWEEQLKEIF